DSNRGIALNRLLYSVCSPSIDPSLVVAASQRFKEESDFLDDRPGSPLRFMSEPNLTQLVRKATAEVDPQEARRYLEEQIRDAFRSQGQPFDPVFFPSGHYEVPDEVGDGRPLLVVLGFDAFFVEADGRPPKPRLGLVRGSSGGLPRGTHRRRCRHRE